jgi:ectoine hydroxylase
VAESALESSVRHHGLGMGEKRAWEQDGFFVRTAVFDASELASFRAAGERVVARAEAGSREGRDYRVDGNRYVEGPGETIQYEHDDRARTVRVIEPFHHLDPLFERLIDDARIVDPMCDLIGTPAVALWTDKINLKRPREGSAFRWHQDSPYWMHAHDDVDRLPNVMIALDDANEENGCFRVIRGSHRRGCLPGTRDGSVLGPLFTDPACFDASQAVVAVVPAGSLVFFSPHTVHGSEPNRSERPRRAMVLTYQAADRRMFKVDAIRNAGLAGGPRAAARS